jgi:hypothetical protein
MTLRACMTSCGLEDSVKVGLRALGRNSDRVEVIPPARASESVALDEALRTTAGQEHRWDYGVGLTGSSNTSTAWIEIHPASSKDVGVFLNKLQWLKAWLRKNASKACLAKASFHWVATAGVSIDEKRRRRLNQAGVVMPQKVVSIR